MDPMEKSNVDRFHQNRGGAGRGDDGEGIAHVFARAGYKVILRDVEQRFLDRGLETIGKNLDREMKKGKIRGGGKAELFLAGCSR